MTKTFIISEQNITLNNLKENIFEEIEIKIEEKIFKKLINDPSPPIEEENEKVKFFFNFKEIYSRNHQSEEIKDIFKIFKIILIKKFLKLNKRKELILNILKCLKYENFKEIELINEKEYKEIKKIYNFSLLIYFSLLIEIFIEYGDILSSSSCELIGVKKGCFDYDLIEQTKRKGALKVSSNLRNLLIDSKGTFKRKITGLETIPYDHGLILDILNLIKIIINPEINSLNIIKKKINKLIKIQLINSLKIFKKSCLKRLKIIKPIYSDKYVNDFEDINNLLIKLNENELFLNEKNFKFLKKCKEFLSYSPTEQGVKELIYLLNKKKKKLLKKKINEKEEFKQYKNIINNINNIFIKLFIEKVNKLLINEIILIKEKLNKLPEKAKKRFKTPIILELLKEKEIVKEREIVEEEPKPEIIIEEEVETKNILILKKFIKKNLNYKKIIEKPKPVKGARDFSPFQMRVREEAFNIIRGIFKKHGGVEIDTPVFELRSTLMDKYGEESKLIYDINDQGGELLSLRYDLTVPFARYVASTGFKPIRRYHIGKVYRREKPSVKQGRYREFYQCDFDIAGEYKLMESDSEMLLIIQEILNSIPNMNEYELVVNHRGILDGMMEECNIPSKLFRTVCSSIDKLDKLKWNDVRNEIIKKGISIESTDLLKPFIENSGEPFKTLKIVKKMFKKSLIAKKALKEMKLLFKYCKELDVKIKFDLSLARGLDYYTGLVMEAKLLSGSVGSICGGGRYDNLLGMFSSKRNLPSVGMSIGIERIFLIMEKSFKERETKINYTNVYVCSLIEELNLKKLNISSLLWKKGIFTQFYQGKTLNRNTKKKVINFCLKEKITFLILLGDNHEDINEILLKNLDTRNEFKFKNENELIEFEFN